MAGSSGGCEDFCVGCRLWSSALCAVKHGEETNDKMEGCWVDAGNVDAASNCALNLVWGDQVIVAENEQLVEEG